MTAPQLAPDGSMLMVMISLVTDLITYSVSVHLRAVHRFRHIVPP
jgi:hypothetical protein